MNEEVMRLIVIGGVPYVAAAGGWGYTQRHIYEQKQASRTVYSYRTADELWFELTAREHIVEAARGLNQSGVGFATFKTSRCNELLWTLTPDGGFRLKPNVPSSEAVRDIYSNGRMYAFECATAIVIVFYKAVLESIGEPAFNYWFSNLYIRDWQYDSDLRLIVDKNARESFLGDVLYFKNPEFNPDTPQWQGENVVKLSDDMYYGHGIGIGSASMIIASLNENRRRGAVQSAYLMDEVVYPDFIGLYALSKGQAIAVAPVYPGPAPSGISARIGRKLYLA
jgi:protein-glutamine gamma-glutamyltransferase